eukprot:222539-Pelagomonas_calceolata.AAC.1
MDSINHVALRCFSSTMSGMRTNRHHASLSSCVKALSKGRYHPLLVYIACQNEKLLEQGIEVPENMSRALPD